MCDCCVVQIERYAKFISVNPEMHERLSKAELDHARRSVSGTTSAEKPLIQCGRYSRLLEYHFNQAVLQSLPLQQRSLEEDVAFMPPMGTCIYAF